MPSQLPFHDKRLRLPCRLGTSSYIIPADIIPNLHHLSGRVDDVELILFESDEFSNIPSHDDVQAMAVIAREADLTFTVHLPLDIHLGSADEAERVASVGKCQRVIERMSPVDPFAWVLHLHGDHRGHPPTNDVPRWTEENRRSLSELLDGGPPSRMICIEVLDYNFDLVERLVKEFDLSVCMDVGHLMVNGRDVPAHLDRWMSRSKVFHVHGVNPEGKDHCHLGHLPPGFLEDLMERLSKLSPDDDRVVTMEIFGEDDFEQSLRTVAERTLPWQK